MQRKRLIDVQTVVPKSEPTSDRPCTTAHDSTSKESVAQPSVDLDQGTELSITVSSEASPRHTESSSPSTPQKGKDSLSGSTEHDSNETTATDISPPDSIISPRPTRRYSSIQEQRPKHFNIDEPPSSISKVSKDRRIPPALVSKLRQKLTSTRRDPVDCVRADDSLVGALSPLKLQYSLAASQRENHVIQAQLQNQRMHAESMIESHELELQRMQKVHAQELETSHQKSQEKIVHVNEQLTSTGAEKRQLSRRLKNVEQQLSVVQGQLGRKDVELFQMRLECQSLKQQNESAMTKKQLQPQPLRPRDLGMMLASPAYTSRIKEHPSSENSQTVVELRSQLRHQRSETAREKARADGLITERDEARSEQAFLNKEVSKLTLGWEFEYNKCKILQCHMEDEPSKTEKVDHQLNQKDEMYKTLEKRFGDCLAENAELRSSIGHVQENADWDVASLEGRLAREHELLLDTLRSRDAYLESHQSILAIQQTPTNDAKRAVSVDTQWKIAMDENRTLRLHLDNALKREGDLREQVLLEKSNVGEAQRTSREKDHRISELVHEKSQSDREVEHLKMQALEHGHLINTKDKEIRAANQSNCMALEKMAAKLEAVVDNGTMILLWEKQNDIDQLQNVLAQYTETNGKLQARVDFLEETHFWDTSSARKAQEAHEADTSRMIAAEEQVAELVKKLSCKEPLTNEGLWDQWRQCDASRIEIRQAFQDSTHRIDDLEGLSMDLLGFVSTLYESLGPQLVLGEHIPQHYKSIFDRAKKILKLDEVDDQPLRIVYPQPLRNANESFTFTEHGVNNSKIPSTTPQDYLPGSSTNAVDMGNETPNTRSKRKFAEQERKCGIFQSDDGTWDINLEFALVAQLGTNYESANGSRYGKPENYDAQSGAVMPESSASEAYYCAYSGTSSCDGNASEGSEHETPHITQPVPEARAAESNLLQDLKKSTATFSVGFDDGKEPICIPRPPPGLDGAQATRQKNLAQLAQMGQWNQERPVGPNERPAPVSSDEVPASHGSTLSFVDHFYKSLGREPLTTPDLNKMYTSAHHCKIFPEDEEYFSLDYVDSKNQRAKMSDEELWNLYFDNDSEGRDETEDQEEEEEGDCGGGVWIERSRKA